MTRFRPAEGFSFIELLIAMAVFSILFGAILGFFSAQRRTYLREDLRLERDQNLRTAINTISRELQSAGAGAAGEAFLRQAASWVPAAYLPSAPLPVVLDANPKITRGAGGLPNVITFAGSVATETNPTTLSEKADGTRLTLSLSRSETRRQYRVGDIVYVGYLPEYARVAAVSDNILTVDADPGTPGLQALSAPHAAGAPVGEVSVVSYAVFNDNDDPSFRRHEAGRPVLKRKVNAGGFYPVAENISRMKVSEPNRGVLRIALTGRTAFYRGAGAGGDVAFLTADIAFRSGALPSIASDCVRPAVPTGLVLAGGLDDMQPCKIRLSWDPVDTDASGNDLSAAGCPVTGYRIYFDVAPGVYGNHMDVGPADAAGTFLDVSGTPASVYYVSVAAKTDGGFGKRTPEASITDTTPPKAPTGVSAAPGGLKKIVLSWEANGECDLARYYVLRKKDGGGFALVADLPAAGGADYTDVGLPNGTYTYVVEAVDGGGDRSGFSEAATLTMPAP